MEHLQSEEAFSSDPYFRNVASKCWEKISYLYLYRLSWLNTCYTNFQFCHVLFNCVLTISQRTLLIDFGDLFGNPENPILAYSRSPLNLGEELNCQQQSPLFSIWSSFRLLRILLGKLEYLKRIINFSIWDQQKSFRLRTEIDKSTAVAK